PKSDVPPLIYTLSLHDALPISLAVWFNCNLPIAVALVWITNPLTMPFFFYLTYRVGAFLLNRPAIEVNFELSVDWLSTKLMEIGDRKSTRLNSSHVKISYAVFC